MADAEQNISFVAANFCECVNDAESYKFFRWDSVDIDPLVVVVNNLAIISKDASISSPIYESHILE